ncbi:MAG: YczE/YyaS/YitT family protein [Actinomycetes bacterium]
MTLQQRLRRLFGGYVLIAVAIALNVRSTLGLGPLFVLFQGLERHGLLTIGTATIVTNVVLLAFAMALRERPGLGTLGQVFLVGPMTDLALLATPHVHSLVARTAYLLAAFVILCVGAVLYLSADLGAGPYDAVMRGLYRNSRRLPLAVVRLSMESTALLLGWLLGGDVGIGTLLIGLGIGPGLAFGLRRMRALPARYADQSDDESGQVTDAVPPGLVRTTVAKVTVCRDASVD